MTGYLIEYGVKKDKKNIFKVTERNKAICSQGELIKMLSSKPIYTVWSAKWINVEQYKGSHPNEHLEEIGF